MTAFRSFPLALLFVLAPTFAHADSQSQALACERLEAVAEPFAEMEEMQEFMVSPCLDLNIRLTQQFVTRLAERVSATSGPQTSASLVSGDRDADAFADLSEQLADTRRALAGLQIRQALLSHKPGLALSMIRELSVSMRQEQAQLSPETGRFRAAAVVAWEQNLAEVEDILTGTTERSSDPVSPPDLPFWILDHRHPNCGTGELLGEFLATWQPTAIDAWLAIGEPEMALRELLLRYWQGRASDLDLPIRLHELAVQVYGPDRAEAAFRSALDSVTITKTPLQHTARIELFGLSLPLPIGALTQSLESATRESGSAFNPRIQYYSEADFRAALEKAWQETEVNRMIDLFVEEREWTPD